MYATSGWLEYEIRQREEALNRVSRRPILEVPRKRKPASKIMRIRAKLDPGLAPERVMADFVARL